MKWIPIVLFIMCIHAAATARPRACTLHQHPLKNNIKYLLNPQGGADLFGVFDRRTISLYDFSNSHPFPTISPAKHHSYSLTQTNRVLVLLVDFGEDGPIHSIKEKEDYKELLFANDPMKKSMASYFTENSSGRFAVEGEVQGWVQVDHPSSHYGSDRPGSPFQNDNLNGSVWRLIQDGVDAVETPLDLSQFDQIDRYDWDKDGNFDEPDGYVDHFILIHAGAGEEEGGGDIGEDAIWTHRAMAHYQPPGLEANVGPKSYQQMGGILADPKHDIWILDYLMMPEDGKLGTFCHEFAHDLGLPDLYDLHSIDGSESSVGYWDLMGSGGWSAKADEDPGTTPTHLSAWGKMELGWLDYDEIVISGEEDVHMFSVLNRAEYAGDRAQALKIQLPDETKTIELIPPVQGRYYGFSGQRNSLNHKMDVEVDLSSVESATLSFKTFYEIETDFDYAFVEIKTDSGRYRPLQGTITTEHDPNGRNQGHGITGSTQGEWIDASFDLTPFVGQKRVIRFHYITDLSNIGVGWGIDEIHIPEINFDYGFEAPMDALTFRGFKPVKEGKVEISYGHYYLLEWRTLFGYDLGLTGAHFPYYLGIKRFSYQPGLLVWYRNESYEAGDNNVGLHPEEGGLLVVDARPTPQFTPSLFSLPRAMPTRVQIHDATFGFESGERFLFVPGAETPNFGGIQAVSVFSDRHEYTHQSTPYSSVRIPSYGLTFSLLNQADDGSAVQLAIHYSAPK